MFINATPEAIWQAITDPDFTERYFYGASIEHSPEHHRSVGPDGSVWGGSATRSRRPAASARARLALPL